MLYPSEVHLKTLFRCPNIESAELCEQLCEDDFAECLGECDDINDAACIVNCSDFYYECENKCPCKVGGECENGCPCPNFECKQVLIVCENIINNCILYRI